MTRDHTRPIGRCNVSASNSLRATLDRALRENHKLRREAVARLLDDLGIIPDSPAWNVAMLEFNPEDVDDFTVTEMSRFLARELDTIL